jgi:hypothetical protein
MKLARILLMKGADPNATNRLGSTALAEPVRARRLDCARLLLEAGADPTIRDNDNMALESHTLLQFDKDFRRLFVEARNKKTEELIRQAILEVGRELTNCDVCDSPNAKRCKGCYMAFYCDHQCQISGWNIHKKECKNNRQQYQEVNFLRQQPGYVNTDLTKKEREYNYIDKLSVPEKGHFIVKVQIPLDNRYSKQENVLTIYNEKKTVFGYINEEDTMYSKLYQAIKEGGVFGDKGFFHAILDVKGTQQHLKINPTLLPPELW